MSGSAGRGVFRGPKKRSFSIRGHRTSLSLEDEFWDCLADCARRRSMTVSALVTRIDEERVNVGLSSAVRTFILKDLMRRAGVVGMDDQDVPAPNRVARPVEQTPPE